MAVIATRSDSKGLRWLLVRDAMTWSASFIVGEVAAGELGIRHDRLVRVVRECAWDLVDECQEGWVRLEPGGRGPRNRERLPLVRPPAPGSDPRRLTAREGDQVDIQPSLGLVPALSWREAVVHHPDEPAGLEELLAPRARVALAAVGCRGEPGMVERLGARDRLPRRSGRLPMP